jgi:uncharacterized membrane protein
VNANSRVVRAKVLRTLRRYLIAGLLVWVPVLATVLVLRFIVGLMDRTLLLLPPQLRPEAVLGVNIPGLGALLSVLVLLITGLLVTNIIGRTLVGFWEDLLNRIPFIRAVYGGVKSFSETVLSNSGNSFKKALLIEYPRKGAWSVGFQTAGDIAEITERTGEPQVCVFIPTTPNPTSGFIVMVPRSQVIELDMSVEAALKMIVTLGVVAPPVRQPTGTQGTLPGAGR